MIRDSCKHYVGLFRQNVCAAGVTYADVEEPSARGIDRFPCFSTSVAPGRCAKREMLTPAEIAEQDRQAAESLKAYLGKLNGNICPFCDTPIERRVQVGRCVYAEPCNHRLYQGRLTPAEREANRSAPLAEQTGLWDK